MDPAGYQVALDVFEGPLDLLLHLIRKHEVDIHDIPIALITAQYLEAIALMQELDLDVAGEFLVMAATLIHIKSKIRVTRWFAGCSSIRSSRRPLGFCTSASSFAPLSGCGRTAALRNWPATSTSRSSRSISSA